MCSRPPASPGPTPLCGVRSLLPPVLPRRDMRRGLPARVVSRFTVTPRVDRLIRLQGRFWHHHPWLQWYRLVLEVCAVLRCTIRSSTTAPRLIASLHHLQTFRCLTIPTRAYPDPATAGTSPTLSPRRETERHLLATSRCRARVPLIVFVMLSRLFRTIAASRSPSRLLLLSEISRVSWRFDEA